MDTQRKKFTPRKHSIFKIRLYRNLRRLRPIIILAILVIIIMMYRSSTQEQEAEYYIKDYKYINTIVEKKLHESVLEEKGRGCQMPVLDPMSDDVEGPELDRPRVVCSGLDWVQCYKSKCSVVEDILRTMNDIECTYKDIIYVNDQVYYYGEPIKVFGSDKYILNGSDHVKVSCSAKPVSRFHIVSQRWFGYKAGFRPVPKLSPPGREGSLNVLMLVFDSASHLGFSRKMPKSYKLLQDETVILNGYNIVGDGTPCALFPILSGKSDLEQPDTRQTMSNSRIDPRSLIFHLLEQDGYRTAYFEDMPWIGTFTYRYNGFASRPADHYLRALLLDESKQGAKMWFGLQRRYCFGAVPQYSMMLNLTDHFFQLDGKRFGLTFIADITHDDINMLGAADEELVSFIRNFTTRSWNQDTTLLVMGDHGPRYSFSRTTYQSKLEERLPLVAIRIPEHIQKSRPGALSALKGNADVLTTPFDIHTTLLDLMELEEHANPYVVPGADYPRGLSLLKPISKSRSCGEAGVMTHWCACTKWYNLSREDPLYSRAAYALANFINHLTDEKRSLCAERSLMSISWVMKQTPDTKLLNYRFVNEEHRYLGNSFQSQARATREYFQAKISLNPGESVFEGTMTYYIERDDFQISEREISRTNMYGEEARCVSRTHPHLNKYCYCNEPELSQLNDTQLT